MKQTTQRIITLTKYYLYGITNNPIRFFLLLTWPVSDLLIWSFTAKFVQSGNSTTNFLVSTIVCFLVWTILWQIQSEMCYPFLRDIYGKSLRNLLIAPINFTEITISLFLSGLCKVIVSSFVIVTIAYFYFLTGNTGINPVLIPFIINTLFFGITLGIISISIIIRFGPQLDFFIRTLPFFLWPFMCVYYPRESLPLLFKNISYFIPTSYVFENIRSSLAQKPIIINDIWLSTSLNLLYLFVSTYILKTMFEQAKKNGNLTRS